MVRADSVLDGFMSFQFAPFVSSIIWDSGLEDMQISLFSIWEATKASRTASIYECRV